MATRKRKTRKSSQFDKARARRLALTAIALTAAGIFVFGLGFGSGVASPPPPPAPPKSMAEQIVEDVQQALNLNARAQTNEEWQTSGYTPADIFRNVDDLKSSESAQAL